MKLHIPTTSERYEIETRTLTIVCPSADAPHLEYEEDEHADRRTLPKLDFETCLAHARTATEFHPNTARHFVYVCRERLLELPADKLLAELARGEIIPPVERRAAHLSTGELHVLGRIDLTLRLKDQGERVVWSFPEAGLHPRTVLRLTDFLINCALNQS